MSYELIENKAIGEKYYKFTVDGLRVYVAPKKLSSTIYAVLGVDFGSADTMCIYNGVETELPSGIAHFLEHKMFENEDGSDAFEQFSLNGANANAYTAASKTCYMFSCTDNFESNLKLLLNVVTVPHFTKQSVEKEKSIINQEIRMYKDDPYWKMHFSLLEALYHKDTIKADPAGTENSVAVVTPQLLYDTHRMFYTAENMVLCVCGDVAPDEVEDIVRRYLKPLKKGNVKRVGCNEPKDICKKRVESFMDVAAPLFAIGIKCDDLQIGEERIQACAENEIILQLVFGKSGEFYNRCYEEGLLGDRFSADFSCERGTSYIMLCGSTPDPERLYLKTLEEIRHRKESFCTPEEFERAKKVCYASALDTFNSTEGTASALISFVFDGGDVLEYTDKLRNASYEAVKVRFCSAYDTERMAFSVIYDKEEE